MGNSGSAHSRGDCPSGLVCSQQIANASLEWLGWGGETQPRLWMDGGTWGRTLIVSYLLGWFFPPAYRRSSASIAFQQLEFTWSLLAFCSGALVRYPKAVINSMGKTRTQQYAMFRRSAARVSWPIGTTPV
ncbi:hypothetical protein BaRGS_00020465 [Batillaria attramentaria]|uniref:Uncharacterized protein n=1 Tax=Batillaria attramentaria TaxID=370345 RepID=A0ABD0KM40_9CAEN